MESDHIVVTATTTSLEYLASKIMRIAECSQLFKDETIRDGMTIELFSLETLSRE